MPESKPYTNVKPMVRATPRGSSNSMDASATRQERPKANSTALRKCQTMVRATLRLVKLHGWKSPIGRSCVAYGPSGALQSKAPDGASSATQLTTRQERPKASSTALQERQNHGFCSRPNSMNGDCQTVDLALRTGRNTAAGASSSPPYGTRKPWSVRAPGALQLHGLQIGTWSILRCVRTDRLTGAPASASQPVQPSSATRQ